MWGAHLKEINMRNSAAKNLTALRTAGLIEGWNRSRVKDERGFMETIHTVTAAVKGVGVSFEVFGCDAQMFVVCPDQDTFLMALRHMSLIDSKVNRGWGPPTGFSVDVEYFKGPRWWE